MIRALQRRLSVKVVVTTVGTMMVLLGLSSWLTSRDYRRAVVELEQETNNRFAGFVYNTLLFSMAEGKMEELRKILQNTVETAGVEFLRVVSPDGVIKYSGRSSETGQPLAARELVDLVRRGASSSGMIEMRGDDGKVTHAVPLHNQGLCTTCHRSDGKYLGAVLVGVDFSEFHTRLASVGARHLAVLGLSAALVAAVVYLCLRVLILRPVFRVEAAAQRMAQGDLTQPVDVPGEDEMARLASHVNTLRSHLRESIGESKGVAEALVSAVEELDRASGNLVTIALEQSGGAAQQASAVQEATTTAEEIAATSGEISANVESVERVAEETYAASVRGRESVRDAIEGMEQVKQKVKAIADSMVGLGKKSQKIGGIVEIIDEISEQTHLVALNAAIEAAGAGDHGKRFGVVAGEVRRLAERTVEATAQIRRLVEGIQDSTNEMVLATEKGASIVMGGASRVDKIGESLQDMLALVEQTKESSKEITVATQQQATAGEQLVLTITDINDVAIRVNRSADEVERSVIRLKDLARNLKTLAEQNRLSQKFTL